MTTTARWLTGLALAALMAGCNQAGDGAATAEDGANGGAGSAATAGGAVKRQAGLWKNTVEVVKFEVPGMTDDMRKTLTDQMTSATATETCLTPEQVANEDLASALSSQNGQCNFTRKEVTGGRIDVAGTCDSAGRKVEMALKGTVAPTRSDVTVTTVTEAVPGTKAEMVMRVQSVRTGACPA